MNSGLYIPATRVSCMRRRSQLDELTVAMTHLRAKYEEHAQLVEAAEEAALDMQQSAAELDAMREEQQALSQRIAVLQGLLQARHFCSFCSLYLPDVSLSGMLVTACQSQHEDWHQCSSICGMRGFNACLRMFLQSLDLISSQRAGSIGLLAGLSCDDGRQGGRGMTSPHCLCAGARQRD